MSWPVGLGVWFSLWVREVPGSNPGLAQRRGWIFFCFFRLQPVHGDQDDHKVGERRSSRNENAVITISGQKKRNEDRSLFCLAELWHPTWSISMAWNKAVISRKIPTRMHELLVFLSGDVPMFVGWKNSSALPKKQSVFRSFDAKKNPFIPSRNEAFRKRNWMN